MKFIVIVIVEFVEIEIEKVFAQNESNCQAFEWMKAGQCRVRGQGDNEVRQGGARGR